MTRSEALIIVDKLVKSQNIRKHLLAAEAAMEGLYRYFAANARKPELNEEAWALVGLLHDADYEAWPDEHPRRIVALLRERGEEDLADAINAHATSRTGVQPRSLMDKALVACDELSGFLHACALVRPDRLRGLERKSVQKKLKSTSFAAKVDRAEIQAGVVALGVDLDAHIAMIVAALREHEEELGLLPPG